MHHGRAQHLSILSELRQAAAGDGFQVHAVDLELAMGAERCEGQVTAATAAAESFTYQVPDAKTVHAVSVSW